MIQILQGDNLLLVLAILSTLLGIYFYYRHITQERPQQDTDNPLYQQSQDESTEQTIIEEQGNIVV